ncbi:MAG: hypothetical protein BGO98_10340 [Myxococcales bacterium 68-20]|nr:hypothetical protein [Myxococcales bacterium]OJY18049.1 MAG: hypothetical protein BGO98_10340 [Myxococcales bacterium 68-20]
MNLRIAPWALVLGTFAIIAGCSQTADEDEAVQGEDAYSQAQVDGDPTLKALQLAAADVNQYEINVADIDVPVPNASVGTQVNGFSTRGLDWFKNPNVGYPNNKSWDQGTDTGKKCQWAAVFRFNAIFSDPPAEAVAMRELEGGRWSGSFWSWIDDYASTNSVGHPSASYAWSSGLWKWIGASGRDGLCRLPTKTMVARMMTACMAQANANDGDPKGCRMPGYNPAYEPAPDAGGGDDDGVDDADAGNASADGGFDAGASDAGAGDGG